MQSGFATFFLLLSLLSLSFGFPALRPRDDLRGGHFDHIPAIDEWMLSYIAPNSSTCNGAQFPDQCLTNEEVTALNLTDIATNGVSPIQTTTEMVAALALMAIQSHDFKINEGTFKGKPAGTRAMLSNNAIQTYAGDIAYYDSDFLQKLKILGLNSTDDYTAQVLQLINSYHQYDFGSAFWVVSMWRDQYPVNSEADFHSLVGNQSFHGAFPQPSADDVHNCWLRACTKLGGCY